MSHDGTTRLQPVDSINQATVTLFAVVVDVVDILSGIFKSLTDMVDVLGKAFESLIDPVSGLS